MSGKNSLYQIVIETRRAPGYFATVSMKRYQPKRDVWLRPLRKDWRRTLNRQEIRRLANEYQWAAERGAELDSKEEIPYKPTPAGAESEGFALETQASAWPVLLPRPFWGQRGQGSSRAIEDMQSRISRDL